MSVTMTASAEYLNDAEAEARIETMFDVISAAILAHSANEDGSGTIDVTATAAALGMSFAIYSAMRPELSSRREIRKFAEGFGRELVGLILDARADMEDAGLHIQ